MKDYLTEIKTALLKLHGVESKHLQTVPITEVFQGKTIWEGEVEVFELDGHEKAKKAYCWGYPDEKGKGGWEIVTVLEIPPVTSPETAVKVAIAAHVRLRKNNDRKG